MQSSVIAKVKPFIFGLLIGLAFAVGIGVTSADNGPRITGDDGNLDGYEVVDRDGDRICEDPWVSKDAKMISCE